MSVSVISPGWGFSQEEERSTQKEREREREVTREDETRGADGGKGWFILVSPSPRHRAPPPPYLYANELHFAILMFQPSRPGLARKGAQDTRKRVRPAPYMFTTYVLLSPVQRAICSAGNYDRRIDNSSRELLFVR